jgi:hypothetical protein
MIETIGVWVAKGRERFCFPMGERKVSRRKISIYKARKRNGYARSSRCINGPVFH